MTLADYMDPERFPQSTQRGLSPMDQLMIDAMNYDDVLESDELGEPIPPDKLAVVQELREKYAAREEVMAEIKRMTVSASS